MKQIINLTKNPEDVLKTIVDLYSSNTDTLPLYRGAEEYTVKYAFSEGTAVIGIKVLPNFYRKPKRTWKKSRDQPGVSLGKSLQLPIQIVQQLL